MILVPSCLIYYFAFIFEITKINKQIHKEKRKREMFIKK